MSNGRRGTTLIELIMAIGMMGILVTTVTFVYQVHFKSWNQGYMRSLIRSNLSQALEQAGNSLRQAQTIDSLTESSITFTADLGGGSGTYRLYLFHTDDPEPNPPYTQSTYSLRLAKDDVEYGDGAVLSSDIAQPSEPPFAINDRVIDIRLTALKGGEQVTMRTKVRSRNL